MDVLLGVLKIAGMMIIGLCILVVEIGLANTTENSLRNLRFQRENKEF